MLKDLNLSTHPRDGQTLTGNINVCNVQAKSSALNTVTLIVSGDPVRQIVFAFPDNLAPDEPYTAVIQLPRKVVEVLNVPEIDIPVEIPLAAEEHSEVHFPAGEDSFVSLEEAVAKPPSKPKRKHR